jgi:ArsR family transcriptional regulator
MNISTPVPGDETLAQFFSLLGQPVRLQILLTIGSCEACVCHLEAFTGLRQAAVSQQLMLLRDAGLVSAQREGRNIYYRLARPGLLELIQQAARCAGIPVESNRAPLAPCPCPHCTGEKDRGCDGDAS